jgi:hypothetical protein
MAASTVPETDRVVRDEFDEPTGWTGWIGFAAVMMMIVGGLSVFQGFIAAVNDQWVVWGNQANLYLDLSTWGWIHMIAGAILVLAGVGLLTGSLIARTVGVIVASLSLVANFLFLPAYPFWAATVIIIDLLVIWALVVHGREMKSP